MDDLLKVLAPLGVGGILAAFIFWCYRQDRLACKDREKVLTDVLRQSAEQQESLARSVREVAVNIHQAMERQGNDMRMVLDRLIQVFMKGDSH